MTGAALIAGFLAGAGAVGAAAADLTNVHTTKKMAEKVSSIFAEECRQYIVFYTYSKCLGAEVSRY